MAGFDAPYVLGLRLPWPADRAEGRSRARPEEARHERSPTSAAPAAPTPTRFIGVMSVEFQRLGIFGDWDHPYLTMDFQLPGGDRAGARASSSSGGSSTRARSRSTGASTAAPRWPKRKSSTRTTRRRRSTSSSRCAPTAPRSSRARVPELAGPRRLGADLDDDALDDPVEPGDRLPSGVRLRGLRSRRPRGDRRGGAGAESRGSRRA